MANRFDVEKLDRTVNYSIWKKRMKDALVSARLWKPVEGTRPDIVRAEEWAEVEA